MRVIAGIIIGTFFGLWLAAINSPSIEPRDNKQQDIKTVTKVEHVKVNVLSPDCSDALKLASRIQQALTEYEAVLGRETLVQDKSYMAMNDNSQKSLNDAVAEHRAIKTQTLQVAIDMQDLKRRYAQAKQNCSADIQDKS